ncbi:MAG: hypothetical protein IKU94_05735, partial [Bacteroidaceae bacterium]|nr:hypothetical protein [Bacteroidaceae bacterium]
VILNLVQDLTEDWEIKARGEMLKQVQHDNIATIKTQNPTPKGGILCFKRLGFATENALFGAFLGCFYRISQKCKTLSC